MKPRLPLNVWILTIAASLAMCIGSLIAFVAGIVGAEIAPAEDLATLPAACITLGTVSFAAPATQFMKRFGRRRAFLVIMFLGIATSCLASFAISIGSFWLFCFSVFLYGLNVTGVMQFRFAAIESVSGELIPKAASCVLIGGITAAFLGPEAAYWGRNLLDAKYAGSFLMMAVLFFLSWLVLFFFKNPTTVQEETAQDARPLSTIARQPLFWLAIVCAAFGYGMMSFIMTATPVSMHVMDGHSLHNTKWVIQSHALAMYVPSLITGALINRFGLGKVLSAGIFFMAATIIAGLAGHDIHHYWLSLVALGLGWNFLFVGGTTLLPSTYRSSEKYKVQTANELGVFGCQATAALSAGWVVFTFGWEAVLWSTVPIVALLIWLVAKYSMSWRATKS